MGYLEQLSVPTLDEYSKNISKIDKDELKEPKDDFIFVLRPFMWYHLDSAMQFDDVNELLFKTAKVLPKHPDCAKYGVTKYLASIIAQKSPMDFSGWAYLAASSEMASSVDLKELAKNADEDTQMTFTAFAKKLQGLEGVKHTVNQLLQSHGDNHLKLIGELIHELLPDDQSFILHGIRFGDKKEEIKEFLKKYISDSKSTSLKEEAGEYLERLEMD